MATKTNIPQYPRTIISDWVATPYVDIDGQRVRVAIFFSEDEKDQLNMIEDGPLTLIDTDNQAWTLQRADCGLGCRCAVSARPASLMEAFEARAARS